MRSFFFFFFFLGNFFFLHFYRYGIMMVRTKHFFSPIWIHFQLRNDDMSFSFGVTGNYPMFMCTKFNRELTWTNCIYKYMYCICTDIFWLWCCYQVERPKAAYKRKLVFGMDLFELREISISSPFTPIPFAHCLLRFLLLNGKIYNAFHFIILAGSIQMHFFLPLHSFLWYLYAHLSCNVYWKQF